MSEDVRVICAARVLRSTLRPTVNGAYCSRYSRDDGETWSEMVRATRHWRPRASHAMLSDGHTMWVLGGMTALGTSRMSNEVWRLADGEELGGDATSDAHAWVLADEGRWSARASFVATASVPGTPLWLSGGVGDGSDGVLRDAWAASENIFWCVI